MLNKLLTSNGISKDIYQENNGIPGMFYGVQEEHRLSLILNQEPGIRKSFDFCELLGGKNFFDQIIVESGYDETTKTFEFTTTETVIGSNLASDILDSIRYQYLDGMWYFSLPLINDDYSHRGNFIKITFVKNSSSSKLEKFIKLSTEIKKLH